MTQKIKIEDLQVGDSGTGAIVVSKAVPKKTRRGSDYLNLDLFDGNVHIYGNYWDWGGKNIPSDGLIVDMVYTVTEYNGNKQLTVSAISTNNDLTSEDFMPSSGLDIDEVYTEASDLIEQIGDTFLRAVCRYVFEEYKSKLMVAPGAKSVHHAYVGGTLVHSLSVAKTARAIATNYPCVNLDLVTAGALLHDIGKLLTYEFNGALIRVTSSGNLYDHLYLGAMLVQNSGESLIDIYPQVYQKSVCKKKLDQLCHIIVSHHGLQEHGAIRPPLSLEAIIVFHADSIDADTEMLLNAAKNMTSMWTDKIYFMNNAPHINPAYIVDLFDE